MCGSSVVIVTLYVVRHGRAGHRDDGDPLDSQRLLDDKGRRQAIWLADRLDGLPITAVWSSPLPRCHQTVEPFAERAGLEVELIESLAEGTDIDTAWAVIASAIEHDGDVVLCSHGDVIPELVRRAQGRGMVVPGRAGFTKGSVWTFTVEAGRIRRGDWDKPPPKAELPA